MKRRTYNIIFDLHTVAGIIISVALYVIFFAGTISFLRDEIIAWERNTPVPMNEEYQENYLNDVDFDFLLEKGFVGEDLYSRDISFTATHKDRRAGGLISPSKVEKKETEEGKGRPPFFTIDTQTAEKSDYFSSYSLGEFFYRLHFFAQLNLYGRSGYIFAGFISLFFLLTIITGVVIHWEKIIKSFYVFRPKTNWKTIWTESHVTLGTIGLPYQFVFAVTGAYFIFGTSILLEPSAKIIFGGESKELRKAMQYNPSVENMPFENIPLEKEIRINDFIEKAKEIYPNSLINEVEINNYGDKNMFLNIEGAVPYEDKFIGSSRVVFRVSDGEILLQKSEKDTSYIEGAMNVIDRLHFGDYGGYGIRLMYILLGFLSCYVIISGVLIWFVARDKKSVSEKKRKVNKIIVNIYMSVCLTMLPATTLTFLGVKLWGNDFEDRKEFIYHIFFYSWLLLSLFFVWRNSNYFTNKGTLLLGGILSILIPIIDGIVTQNWIWNSFHLSQKHILVVNIFWLMIGITALFAFFKIKKENLVNR